MIVFTPLVPIALWVALAVSAVALLCWYAIGSRGRLPRGRLWAIVTLMAAALALPLAILLNPTWLERIPEFELESPGEVTWAGGQVRGPRQCLVTFG